MHPVALTTSSNSAFSKLSPSHVSSENVNNENSQDKSSNNSTSVGTKSSSPTQKHVLKFSVDSMLSEKCTSRDDRDRESSNSPNSVSSEDSYQGPSKSSSASMGPFSMDGILNKHHSNGRHPEGHSAVTPPLLSQMGSERWNGFYAATSFPWLANSSLSPPKGWYKF